MSRGAKRNENFKNILQDLGPHDPDIAYWLEHIVHWFAFLGIVIVLLIIGAISM